MTLDKFAVDYCAGTITRGQDFFREYACTNTHEFFAVAVEIFFERPEGFKNEFPDLYNVLVRLLNQDPLTIQVKLN
jgi:Mlc titration factor MtfA (ptsG expression regulator)